MKLFAVCPKCKNEISFNSIHKTRVEFAMNDGETKTLNCKICEYKNTFKINELYAKESKIAQIIAGLIFFIGTPFLLFYAKTILIKMGTLKLTLIIGSFMLIPALIYKTILKEDRIRVNTFNRGRLKNQ
ncbi:hypothetical protein V8G69_08180 [Gaetbulibacter sp. M235]|uniref:hypothetical protein n=1 Tax=Gaetbulibacter sp. M235 TaxID=3126510 RepID=UPI00374F7391